MAKPRNQLRKRADSLREALLTEKSKFDKIESSGLDGKAVAQVSENKSGDTVSMATQELSLLLLLQDRVGVRQSGHFDHDSHAMSGPFEASMSPAVSVLRSADPSRESRINNIRFEYCIDSVTGEILSQ